MVRATLWTPSTMTASTHGPKRLRNVLYRARVAMLLRARRALIDELRRRAVFPDMVIHKVIFQVVLILAGSKILVVVQPMLAGFDLDMSMSLQARFIHQLQRLRT